MKRLMVVADHALVVQSIRMALRQTAGFRLVGIIDGRASVRDELEQLEPHVVLVDDMQDASDAVDRLEEVAECPDVTAILLTSRMDEGWLDQAFNVGTDAVISKNVHPVALGTLLREVVRGSVVHRPRAVQEAAIPDCPLTARELQILQLAAEGHTNGQIARELWVAEQTVKFHLSNTYRKLGVANRTEASRYAHVHQLVREHEQLAS